MLLRGGNQRQGDWFAVANDAVAYFGPDSSAPQHPHHVGCAMHLDTANRIDQVASMDSRVIRRRAGGYVPCLHALGGVHPGNAVIRGRESGALLKVEHGENHRR